MKHLLKIVFIFWIFQAAAQGAQGVLFLAHGSMGEGCGHQNPSEWEQYLLETMDDLRMTEQELAFEIGFGMWNTPCFEVGLEKLKQRMKAKNQKLDDLHVIPLFLSSFSLVSDMQKYIFKVSEDRPLNIPMARKINFDGNVIYHSAIDYRIQISWILEKRAHELVKIGMGQGFPVFRQKLILVMHGPVRDSDNSHWIEMGNRYVNDLATRFPGLEVCAISLRDDAPDDVRDAATRELRDSVLDASFKNKKALVLPLLLSKGGIEDGILERLEGLTYIWNGETLLPDPIFTQFLTEKLQTIPPVH